ncbi:hypothetical protein BKA83DRAFT_1642210 [Pisolithus microcarpus]|nr:hypothetical protein BKA83DRAFT_1642210 [Pisolithus microcarpus]
MMALHHRRPSRARSRHLVSSLSLLFVAFVAVLCFCSPVAAQESGKKSEYGTVIGIDLGTTYDFPLMNSFHLADLSHGNQ